MFQLRSVGVCRSRRVDQPRTFTNKTEDQKTSQNPRSLPLKYRKKSRLRRILMGWSRTNAQRISNRLLGLFARVLVLDENLTSEFDSTDRAEI